MKKNSVFGLNADLSRVQRWVLNAAPFVLLIVVYGFASHWYLLDNPSGKLLPSYGQMAEQFWKMATVPHRRSGQILLWIDTYASVYRILTAVIAAAITGLLLGITMSFYPLWRNVFRPFVTFFSNVPIIATIVIWMLMLGVGDVFKITLIYLGTVFVITRDIDRAADAFPKETIIKAQSLGATGFGTVYRLMLPQLMPYLLSAVRLVLGAAWIYLITSEMLSATEGLGYRINLVRRYMDMKTIFPYVFVITAWAFIFDLILRFWIAKVYPWFDTDK